MKITQEQAERFYEISKHFCDNREGFPGGCECCIYRQDWNWDYDNRPEFFCEFDKLLDEIEKQNKK